MDIISVIGSDVEALAAAAPTLKEAELRVLIELIRRRDPATNTARLSSRDLAASCKLERRNVVRALDSLAKRCLIATRQGTATSSAIHQINLIQTARMGGVFPTPPPTQNRGYNDTTPELFQHHPGVEATPPPTENTALAAAAGRVEVSTPIPPILDRVLNSRPSHHDAKTLAYFNTGCTVTCASSAATTTTSPPRTPTHQTPPSWPNSSR